MVQANGIVAGIFSIAQTGIIIRVFKLLARSSYRCFLKGNDMPFGCQPEYLYLFPKQVLNIIPDAWSQVSSDGLIITQW